MIIDNLFNYLAAVAIIVVIPGPNILLVMNNSMKYGIKNGILTILGIKLGMMLLFLVSLSGITAILLFFSSIFIFIKWLGVIYLFYLGVSQLVLSFKDVKESKSFVFDEKCFLKGVAISAMNPKGLIFAGAFFPQFIDTGKPLFLQTIVLCGGFIVISLIIELTYAYLSNLLGNIIKAQRIQKILDRISGGVFVLFGIGLSVYKKSN